MSYKPRGSGGTFNNNDKFQQMVARDSVKIRRANNGFVINSDNGMQIAATLQEVKDFLDKKFEKSIDIK